MAHDTIVNRRDFLKYSSITLGALSLAGCANSSNNSQTEPQPYLIDSNVTTTLDKIIIPSVNFGVNFGANAKDITPKELKNLAEYDANGYGVYEDGGALESEFRDDLMASSYSLPVANKPKKLLKFFAITDIHITDKEAPNQLLHLQPSNYLGDSLYTIGLSPNKYLEATMTSVYSPTMLYSTHTLDAAIQTVNALHEKDSVDFGISLGDASNSTQYNETRWYIDVLDGGVIAPSSGINEGKDSVDFQKPYKAVGLHSDIPWYQAIGNHDLFWMGSIPIDPAKTKTGIDLRASYVDDKVLAMPNSLALASNVYNVSGPLYYMGVIDGGDSYGDIIKDGPLESFAQAPTIIPDVKRRSLTKTQWTQEFFNTTSQPKGHGFDLVPEGKKSDFGCYSFKPKSELPIKIIVLDNNQIEDDDDPSIHGRGFLDQERWQWLQDELQAGTDNDELMIIACHIPIAVMPYKRASTDENGAQKDTYMDWYKNTRGGTVDNAVSLEGLIEELHSHPNLLMWMAGHRHVNIIKGFVHDEAEKSFWQVETASLHDFPQQLRMFDIKLNSDYTISIHATNVDPAVKEGTPAHKALKYAVATKQITNGELNHIYNWADPKYSEDGIDPTIKKVDPKSGAYNAQLLLKLTPTMEEKMKTLFPSFL